MSKLRQAEATVIEAARRLVEPTWRSGPSFDILVDQLDRAVRDLDALRAEPTFGAYAVASAPETSHEAAALMRPLVKKVAGKVLQEFLMVGDVGLTAEAVQIRLHGSHQGVSPRVTELARKGWIVDSGRRRQTRSGRDAVVYVATDIAREAARQIKEWSW